MKMYSRPRGFSLIEMVLVLIVIASILVLVSNYGNQRMNQFRRDRTALQMQQILNAGLSYYINQGTWPANLAALQSGNYLPTPLNSPYGTQYTAVPSSSSNNFTVTVPVYKSSDAQVISGELPLASYSGNSVTAQVNIPGQNLNNARSVNFTSVYHSGACVPQPVCPNGTTAQIVVAPAGVTGVFDAPTTSSGGACTSTSYTDIYGTNHSNSATDCTTINAYPISSFAAFTTSAGNPPPGCNGTSEPCYQDPTTSANSFTPSVSNNPQYWRVCLAVQTEEGAVSIPTSGAPSNNQYMFWTQAEGYVIAITRCTPTNGEPAGSSINVWGY